MRVFYAIEFDNGLKEALSLIQRKVREKCDIGKFSDIDNLHLTLRFIGEVYPEMIPRLNKVLEYTVSKFSAFTLEFSRLGEFKRGNKSIIWIGIKKNRRLNELQAFFENKINELGFSREEKPYRPHITLVRQVDINNLPENLLNNINLPPLKYNVTSISLMESTRINGNLRYVRIGSRILPEEGLK